MAVKIRLRRMGAKKAPFYRVVVADSRSPRDGRFIEEIGYYNPVAQPAEIKINEEKATKWIANGAQPTDVVKRLFNTVGINKVHVNEVLGEQSVVLELRVAPEDMGKVIGKQGKVAKAIRTVVKAASLNVDKKVVVEILDDKS